MSAEEVAFIFGAGFFSGLAAALKASVDAERGENEAQNAGRSLEIAKTGSLLRRVPTGGVA